MDTPASCRLPIICEYPYPGFVSWVPSAGFEPASTRGHKEENPIKTRGRYDLPLIPTKAYRQGGGFEHPRITEARDWLACHIGVCPL